ncbi:uncharacterized protein LOC131152382 [Malania oleifera]|uniref:uncharacterized protein LOC131152382 n=1 Tax=Malania oleifera TaxID=397392 RepID=UPI0025AE350F|nr:uncharacterized protein LOC131152382 [Malania oleifera]
MGTEVLRPQDCLIERIRVGPAVFPRRKNSYGNPRINRKPAVRLEKSDQKKRIHQPEASILKRSSCDDLRSAKSGGGNLVMGQVTILRRGESLDSKLKSEALKKSSEEMIVCGTERLGPDPEMVPKHIRIKDPRSVFSAPPGVFRRDVYAGSAFSVSPSPDALPLPSFYKKKQEVSPAVDDSATRDLRRLLRLE